MSIITKLSPFNPKKLSGLALWLSSDKGITSTESGTPVASPMDIATPALWLSADAGVTTVDGKCSVWSDQSGNSRHASQSTADYRPTYVENGLNGRPVLRFDGSDDYLTCVTNGISRAWSGASVFIVCKATTGDGGAFSILTPANATRIRLYLGSSSTYMAWGGRRDDADSFVDTTTAWSSDTAYRIQNAVFSYSAATLSTWKDGVVKVSAMAFQTSGVTSDTEPGGMFVGSYTSTGRWTGDIAEILVYPTALSDADRKRVELYLAYKYGLACAVGQCSAWADQSTNARHASQATAGYRPYYTVNALNGRPVLRFDGVDDFMITGAPTELQGLTGKTSFIVAYVKGPPFVVTSNSTLMAVQPNTNFLHQYADNARLYTKAENSTKTGYTAVLPANALRLHTTVFDGGGATAAEKLKVYIDGTQKSLNMSADPWASSLSATLTYIAIGSTLSYSNYPFYGDIAEIIVFNRALTSAEINQITLYLGRRYGITVATI